MGKLSRGFLGGFQGQLGTAYGCFWRLMDLIKAMPRKSNRPATLKQLMVQLRLALIVDFLRSLSAIIKIGFRDGPSNQSPMNVAVSYHVKNAVTGVYPNYTIDYTKVKLSQGKLDSLASTAVLTAAGAVLEYSWLGSSVGEVNSSPTDKVSLVVYNPAKPKFIIVKDVATRADLEYSLQLPADFAGDEVECYLMVTSDDDKMVSQSEHLASITII